MWNNNNKREDSSAPKTMPEDASRPRPAAMAPPAPQRGTATIGASMHINGEIRTREELVIEGEVDGLVESQSSVVVGPNGKVKANIKARDVAIFGGVRGNVEVSEKIAIRDKGSLIGDIKTAGISIDDGAYFKGSIDIVRPEPRQQSKTTVLSEPAVSAAGD